MIFVTGITGHSGRYFMQELIKQKYTDVIRCSVRESTDTSELRQSGLNLEIVIGDLNDESFVESVFAGVEEVIHIASIFYSENIVKAAINNHIKRIVLVHTTGIYSKYKSASEEYKSIEANINKMLKNCDYDVNVTFLRPTMIYGYKNDRNMMVFIRLIDKFRILPIISKGKSLLQPVNGRDLGKAYYQVLIKKDLVNGDYILSGDKPRSLMEIFQLISLYLGKRSMFISIPLGLSVFLARVIKLISLSKIDFVEKVQRMGENRSFPHDIARNAFGYSPMPFEKGLKLEIDEYLKFLAK